MRRIVSVGLLALLLTACGQRAADPVAVGFDFAAGQLRLAMAAADSVRAAQGKTLAELPAPRSINPDGSLNLVAGEDWCSGFFPGELWYMYEYTGDEFWKSQAQAYTEVLAPQQYNRGTHDLGFMLYCSYGNGYRLAPTAAYREVLLTAARSLASRFDPAVGCIRSWDFNREQWQFPVIIDNMMNLELLFWAARESGDSTLRQIAIAHANTTLKHHFRPDNSTYHVVDYDTLTGAVLQRQTHQGLSDSSAWARGQAWGLYGYTLCYRETRDTAYLAQAERIAAYIFSHPRLPSDLIPYWDYDDPRIPAAPRDASAASITASALYELSGYVSGDRYRLLADTIVDNLTAHYRVAPGAQHGFLLRSSTGSIPGGTEIDVPIVYGDYYYLEALLRRRGAAQPKQ